MGEKIKDAKKEKKALKGLYLKGLRQKAGEICMIRKIQCMVAKFNGEAALQTKYCGVCTDDKKAKMVTSWSNGGDSSAKGPTVSKGACACIPCGQPTSTSNSFSSGSCAIASGTCSASVSGAGCYSSASSTCNCATQ